MEVTAISSSGGTITVTTREVSPGTGMEVYFFIIDLDDRKAKVGDENAPVADGDWVVTGVGFKPQFVGLAITRSNNSSGSPETNNSAAALGISSVSGSGEEVSQTFYQSDSVPTTVTHSLFRSRAIDMRNENGTTVITDCQFTSFDADGWTYAINTQSGLLQRQWFEAIEEASAAGISIPVVQHHRAMQGVF